MGFEGVSEFRFGYGVDFLWSSLVLVLILILDMVDLRRIGPPGLR